MQDPDTEAVAVSGPLYVTEVQPAMPDVPSLPLKVIVTGWLYQPFESGARLGVAPETAGGDASLLIVTEICDWEPFV